MCKNFVTVIFKTIKDVQNILCLNRPKIGHVARKWLRVVQNLKVQKIENKNLRTALKKNVNRILKHISKTATLNLLLGE